MKRILFVILLVAAMLASTGVASAKTTRIDFSGSEVCDESTLTIAKIIEAGPNLHLMQITQTCYDTASSSKLTGTDYLTGGNMHIVGGGKNFILTGTLRMESTEGGVWVGSWVLPANSNTIKVVAHGEGLYAGLQLHWFLSLDGPFSGYILNPGN